MRTIETMTADVVMAFVRHHNLESDELPSLISAIHSSLTACHSHSRPPQLPISIEESQREDHLICLKCMSETILLERHLRRAHGMTAQQYRNAYGLPPDYPMVTASFSKKRSEIAKTHGLGRSKDEYRI